MSGGDVLRGHTNECTLRMIILSTIQRRHTNVCRLRSMVANHVQHQRTCFAFEIQLGHPTSDVR